MTCFDTTFGYIWHDLAGKHGRGSFLARCLELFRLSAYYAKLCYRVKGLMDKISAYVPVHREKECPPKQKLPALRDDSVLNWSQNVVSVGLFTHMLQDWGCGARGVMHWFRCNTLARVDR